MVMDVRRSMALTRIRPFKDNPREIVIRWFPAPASALAFPAWHQFASSIWERDKWNFPPVGEVQDCGQTWITEMNVPGLVGDHYHGTLDQFQHGALYDPNANYPHTIYGLPVGCGDDETEDDVRDINFWKHVATPSLDRWYTAGHLISGNVEIGFPNQDEAWGGPFFPARGGSINNLGVWIQATGNPGDKVRLAIYEAISSTDLAPGQLVADSGDIDTFAATLMAWAAVAVTVNLDPLKLYWFFLNANNPSGSANVMSILAGGGLPIFGMNANFEAGQAIRKAMSYGAWPSAFPPLLDADVVEDDFPAIGVQYDG